MPQPTGLLTQRIGLRLKQDWTNSGTINIIIYDFKAQLKKTGSRSEVMYDESWQVVIL